MPTLTPPRSDDHQFFAKYFAYRGQEGAHTAQRAVSVEDRTQRLLDLGLSAKDAHEIARAEMAVARRITAWLASRSAA